jgi:pectinesterase
MKKLSILLATVVTLLMMTSSNKQITVFMIGDSTMADKNINHGNTERGWGMVLQGCFDESILVDNHALNGRSSKSFIDEGRWQVVLDKIKPGDYVFIQFGHNDEKPKPDRHTDPGTTFDANLKRFVTETRAKGGIPVLFNAVVRRNFYRENDNSVDDESLRKTTYVDEKINSDTLIDTHGAYLLSPRNVAKEMNVAFVDANKVTHDIEQGMGIEGSRKLHMWYKPGENPAIPNGRHDNTHYNIYGAHIVANALADAIAEQVPALKKHVRHYDYVVSKRGRGNFMTLQDAVNAVPANQKTTILVLDGKWHKPTIEKGKNIKFMKFYGSQIE